MAEVVFGAGQGDGGRAENARRVAGEFGRRDVDAAFGPAGETLPAITAGDRGADRARPTLDDGARNIGFGAKALLAAVEPVARAAFLFGEGALIGIGIIARHRPAPVAEHAVDARRADRKSTRLDSRI